MALPPVSVESLEEILGHSFQDKGLLNLALVHASLVEQRGASNERLEFLGDRVLGLVVAELLYGRFPDEDEGKLARRFAGLTSRDALVRVAEDISLARFIQAQHGDTETAERSMPTVSADTLEATLGAMFLDGGLEPARQFIVRRWDQLVEDDLSPPKDAKTALQEWAQGRGLGLPVYELVRRDGPDHAPTFTVSVTVKGHDAKTGQGTSRRGAEQNAAQAMMTALEPKP